MELLQYYFTNAPNPFWVVGSGSVWSFIFKDQWLALDFWLPRGEDSFFQAASQLTVDQTEAVTIFYGNVGELDWSL